MPTMTLISKDFPADMTLEEGSREMVVKITSDALDRENEVLLPDGMDAKEFMRNPIVFATHDYGVKDVVGKVISLRRAKDYWLAKVFMLPRPDGHEGEWLPDTILHIAKFGIMGVSVGFSPLEDRQPTAKDVQTFGQAIQRVYSKWKLIELSIAPLPANQEALIMAVSKGLRRESALKFWPKADIPERPKYSLSAAIKRVWRGRAMSETAASAAAMEIARLRGRVYYG